MSGGYPDGCSSSCVDNFSSLRRFAEKSADALVRYADGDPDEYVFIEQSDALRMVKAGTAEYVPCRGVGYYRKTGASSIPGSGD